MVKTTFVDVTNGIRKDFGTFLYDVTCHVGDFVDFGQYNTVSDYDIYRVVHIVFLPHEEKKIVEVELSFKESI